MAPSLLSHDFLAKPAAHIAASRVNFTEQGLPCYDGAYAVVLDHALTHDECETLVKAAEASTTEGWERAMVNVGGGQQAMIEDIRCCGRIIWDDHDVVSRIFRRIESVPEVREVLRLDNAPGIVGKGPLKRGEVWRFTRCNERMRFLRYTGGEYFRPHCDGTYETPDRSERSYVTLHLYLNDHRPRRKEIQAMLPEEREQAEAVPLVGGSTTFYSRDMSKEVKVLPKAGRILLFQHRSLIHEGAEVVSGVKHTMRTDLMYALDKGENA
ncbi:hypothetical protein BAUCODRAFT_119900 [Baudoinia panamericana UAMH 10762]|uniref:Prolyl 4-hydroxylase alpha subunit domain-containing protein n=1 Tax=Baudoinia panamericana (strain UAMH 10762) TaxID=717646 RepID=M2NHQ4_BAUPA|nr:uncharacterized protein BAUCODRAFT_119900 [Baudoinia panamericana UAMH 10762]EMC98575.1 hypothetical protein BAUCODRAFT_119900 [Baudoinia panamericana UAMH 10762]